MQVIENQINQLRQELRTCFKKFEDLVLSDGWMKLGFIRVELEYPKQLFGKFAR
jgi:hypothetical protein